MVKYRFRRQRYDAYGWDVDEFDKNGAANLNIKPYQPIQDKAIKKHFKELKARFLLATDNARVMNEKQTFTFGGTVFIVYPWADVSAIDKFKAGEW